MPALTSLRRFCRRSRSEKRFLAEALVTLAVASLAIRTLPFRRLAAAAAGSPKNAGGHRQGEGQHIADQARWAVKRVAAMVPWKAVCFQQGLALQLMLRRRGIRSLLHYGLLQDQERGLQAHVWVSLDGNILIGGEAADEYVCLATFPSPQPETTEGPIAKR